MAVFTLGCGLPTMNVVPELNYLGATDPPMDEMHRIAVLFLWAAAIAFPVYVLAAIHASLTARGRAYLQLAIAAFAVQAVLNLLAQPFFGALAMVPVAGGGIAAIIAANQIQVQDRLTRPPSSKLHLWAELITIPVAIVFTAGAITHLDRSFVPDEPNPPRTFDASQAWDMLDGVADDAIAAMESSTGSPISTTRPHRAVSESCEDGAAWDEEWVDLRIEYRLGKLDPGSDTNIGYMAALKEAWTNAGYSITSDSSAEAATGDSDKSYGVAAEQADGITVAYRVKHGYAELEIESGCILNTGEIDTTYPY